MIVEYVRPFAAAAALGCAMLLAGAPGSAAPTPAPQAVATVHGDCSLTVGGKRYLNIKKTCTIQFTGDDGSFAINTAEDDDDDAPRYFAYVNLNGDGTASVSWNGSPQSTHAHDMLGEDFRRKGGCWIGKRGKVCAYKR